MSYKLISMVEHKARKSHQCIWCAEAIAAGTRYLRERSIFDGEPQNHKWHPECKDAANAGWEAGDEEEFYPGENERPPTAADLEVASWSA